MPQSLNPLSANPTKWSNTLKQFMGNLPTNCLSVFNHFVILAVKGLKSTKKNQSQYAHQTSIFHFKSIASNHHCIVSTDLYCGEIMSSIWGHLLLPIRPCLPTVMHSMLDPMPQIWQSISNIGRSNLKIFPAAPTMIGRHYLSKKSILDQKDSSCKWLDEYLLILTEIYCSCVPHVPMTGKILVLRWTSWLYHNRGLNTDDEH